MNMSLFIDIHSPPATVFDWVEKNEKAMDRITTSERRMMGRRMRMMTMGRRATMTGRRARAAIPLPL